MEIRKVALEGSRIQTSKLDSKLLAITRWIEQNSGRISNPASLIGILFGIQAKLLKEIDHDKKYLETFCGITLNSFEGIPL